MYNDTLTVANKIITAKDLDEIFKKINEEIETCEKTFAKEKAQNEKYESTYQVWTLKNYTKTFKVDVSFYDDTNITFDNYKDFRAIFVSRLKEIKNFHLRYSTNYSRKNKEEKETYISQHIVMDVYENKMNIDISLDSKDLVMNEVYEFLKNKILYAQEKYDRLIKKKTLICTTINIAFGLIPSLILLTLLLFVEPIRTIYKETYIAFPIFSLLLAFLIGTIIMGKNLEELYQNIIPKKEYQGYDTRKNKSIYKDDIKTYTSTSEILIGKNTNNMLQRNKIKKLEKKYKKYLKYCLIILLVESILIIAIGNII